MFPHQNAWSMRFKNGNIVVDVFDDNEKRMCDKFSKSQSEKNSRKRNRSRGVNLGGIEVQI